MRDEFGALREALLEAGASPKLTEGAIREIATNRERRLSAIAKSTRRLVWMAAALLALTIAVFAVTFAQGPSAPALSAATPPSKRKVVQAMRQTCQAT